MLAEQRKQQILAELRRNPAVRVADLGRALRVSVASIRRDLADLQGSGLLKRTHGGAISTRLQPPDLSLGETRDRRRNAKVAIAASAAALVQPGDTVFLDAGSTTREIAVALRVRQGVTVVTNALDIGWELAASDLEVILTGGHVRRGVLSQVGPITEQTLTGLHVDKLFLAANGIDIVKGVTTPDLLEAQAKRAMVDRAGEVILVADHSKFGRVTFGHICSLERVHTIITDDGLPRQIVAALEQTGVRLHLVPAR